MNSKSAISKYADSVDNSSDLDSADMEIYAILNPACDVDADHSDDVMNQNPNLSLDLNSKSLH